MFSDYHVHSSFSFDSEESPRAIVEKAIALGMKQICFTDHQDFNWPIEGESPYIDFPKYFEVLHSLRNEYSSKINILKGRWHSNTSKRSGRYQFVLGIFKHCSSRIIHFEKWN